MKNLFTAITTLFTTAPGGVHNDFYDDIGGRLYEGQATEGAEYPYAVMMLIADTPEKTFTEDFENVLIQFSLFSTAFSATEVHDMFTHLKTLFDECALTITGSTLVWMKRVNATLMVDEITTLPGTQKVWHYAVDFEIKTSLS